MSHDNPFEPLRNQIDEIDQNLIHLLHERYKVVHEVGRIKRSLGQPIFVPEREKMVYERVEKMNKGEIPATIMQAIYREIMSGAISLEKPLSVAYLGPDASYSQLAAISKFGRSIKYRVQRSIQDVFHEVEIGRADYGCVPVENSTEGVVNCTLDTLVGAQTHICAEVHVHISHYLMSHTTPENIKRIYSHPQVLGQCRNYLVNNYPAADLIETTSSTAGVIAAKEDMNESAAIGSWLAAEMYDIPVIDRGVEDTLENTTRFLILGMQEPNSTGDDKTSICFGVKDRVGALYDALIPFKTHGITMSMIESRPSKRRIWEYFFFIDIKGHRVDPQIQKALEELSERALFVRVLGSYPANAQIYKS